MEKNIDKSPVERVYEIESYNQQLLITGLVEIDSAIITFISAIDTSGTIEKFGLSEPFGSHGAVNVETKDNNIYFTTMSSKRIEKNETVYLSKYDNQLNLLWDTLVPISSKYYVGARRMEIVNDQMVILSDIRDALNYTNNRVWSHAAAWSLEGEFQWEHLYVQDSAAIHHLDDVERLPNGDLVFMGTVFNTEGQHFWLFRTDSQGCGTVQDTCFYTLDEYFGLDTMVSIFNFPTIDNHSLQILGNPFAAHLVLKSNHKPLDISIYDIQGQLVYEGWLNGTLPLKTENWPNGVYVLQAMDDGQLLGVEKLLKQ